MPPPRSTPCSPARARLTSARSWRATAATAARCPAIPSGTWPASSSPPARSATASRSRSAYALADRADGRDRRTYCLVGDGELNEGSIWEAVALAGHLAPPGLCLIVDANGFQGLGPVSDVLSLEPLAGKLRAFGWAVDEVDGHDHGALERTLGGGRVRPTAIVARTVKGYGVPVLEGQFMSHYRSFRPHERALLLAGLDEKLEAA